MTVLRPWLILARGATADVDEAHTVIGVDGQKHAVLGDVVDARQAHASEKAVKTWFSMSVVAAHSVRHYSV